MQHLILVRHGEYNHTSGELTNLGASDTRKLANRLRVYVANRRVRVLHSPLQRTKHTALIITQELGLDKSQENDWLRPRGECLVPDQKVALLELVTGLENSCDVAIFCTHAPITNLFPTVWGMSIDRQIDPRIVSNACACVINIQTREVTIIRPN